VKGGALVVALALAGCSSRRAQDQAGPVTSAPAVVVQASGGGGSGTDEAAWFRAHYTKFEYEIPMRDGITLFTSVFVPNDAGPSKRYPFLIDRTPYSVAPYGVDRYPTFIHDAPLRREGFIFIHQDVRGRYRSGGTFVDMRPLLAKRGAAGAGVGNAIATDESTDAYDTIEWLLAHVDHNNGKAGVIGQSYDGFYATSAATSGHRALAAVVAMAPGADLWMGDDMHRNGAFNLQETFTFMTRFSAPRPDPIIDENFWPGFDYGTPDGYQFYLDLGPMSEVDATDLKLPDAGWWNEVAAHPDYDAYWQERNLLPRLKNVKAAMWIVGGWYDTEDLYGTLGSYAALRTQNPSATTRLWMGPWKHGGWWGEATELGDTRFGFATAAGFVDRVAAYFRHYLKGGPAPDLAAVEVFETGANRWRRFSAWPPRETVTDSLYLRADGGLAMQPPTDADPAAAFDEYQSDPARPVPYTADPGTSFWSTGYMAEDQRFASRRPDVLVYQTAPLSRDLTIAGPIDVELFVSSTGTDADYVVKVVDAWPGKLPGQRQRDLDDETENRGGLQLLVRGEPFRARYRNSLQKPEALVPGEVSRIAFRLDDVFHTFPRGHRVMIQIQSSWFPFIDRNPQKFVPNIFEATRADFIKADQRIHRATGAASKITFGRLPAADELRTE
jgi:putative CocE/NonD family hydrolase